MKHKLLLLMILVLFSAADAHAEQKPTIELKMEQLLDMLKNPNPENLKTYIQNNLDQSLLNAYPMQDHLDYFTQTTAAMGDFEVIGIQSTTGSDFNLDIQTKGQSKVKRYLIEFNPNTPHGLMGMQQAAFTSFDDLVINDYQKLHQTLLKKSENNEFSGNLLISKDNKTVFNQAYGYADKRFAVKNTLNTRFNLASITKDFTALSILQMNQSGKLNLNDLIGKYIPELPARMGEHITIKHLLRHQSGLGQSFENPKFLAIKDRINDIEDYIDIIKDEPLKFEPGSSDAYSNDGFELLGVIIQRVSGMSYHDYVEQHIFEPIGMNNSGFMQVSLAQKNVARNYTNMSPLGPDEGYVRETIYLFPAIGSASGGAYSTTADMLKYMNAIETSELLDDKHQALFLSHYMNADPAKQSEVGKGAAGGAPGVSTYYMVNFDLGVKLVILSNYDERLAEDMAIHLYQQFKNAKPSS